MNAIHRFYLRGLAITLLALPISLNAADWPLWTAFKDKFIQSDGRVIDYQQASGVTTSEGQAYALFFALVANDKAAFAEILHWTETHLCPAENGICLPAWRWGEQLSGDWGILDPNSASDADLWLTYTLLEAGRLWDQDEYTEKGQTLLLLVKQQEVATLPELGPIVLPGRLGFEAINGWWQLNPSYLPLQLIAGLSFHDNTPLWPAVYRATEALLRQSEAQGFAHDWVHYHPLHGFLPLNSQANIGSYDAIRVYLWLGMLNPDSPSKQHLLKTYNGMLHWFKQGHYWPPEQIDLTTGIASGRGPAGFSAALIPYLKSWGDSQLLSLQLARIERKSHGLLLGEYQHYYDQVLGLFGLGWHEARYQFSNDGLLEPAWHEEN
ncbi:MAG: cellulose synthase complex periplasmic endoglucanase BcsZ [Pseudomonadota bacterium]|nr:cellulose synthase complex periplasmic endoglucanase BcsZ [Pseudomonadota bacterium]